MGGSIPFTQSQTWVSKAGGSCKQSVKLCRKGVVRVHTCPPIYGPVAQSGERRPVTSKEARSKLVRSANPCAVSSTLERILDKGEVLRLNSRDSAPLYNKGNPGNES